MRIRIPVVFLALVSMAGTVAAQGAPAPAPPPPAPAPAPYPAPAPTPYPPAPAPAPYPPAPAPYPVPPPGGYAPQPYYQPMPVAPGPQRDGVTVGLDLGLGFTNVSADGGGSDSEGGLSGLNISLGGFISPTMAILVRISGTTFDGGFDQTFISGFLGGTVQAWVAPRVFVGGGAGIGILTCSDCEDSETGLAVTGRAGFEISQGRSSGFHIAAEITPGFYDGGRVTSIGLQIGWQHY
jgi:hypothetical protein